MTELTLLARDPWQSLAAAWARAWRVPDLTSRVRLRESSRMRVSLGRCAMERGEIRIASFVLSGPRALLEEVLCHELAHLAAAARHGRHCRPHGPEWKALMRAAGREPRARIPAGEVDRLLARTTHRRVVWEHRCPFCQASRLAGRPVSKWRCVRCRAAGLTGRLAITRLGDGGGGGRVRTAAFAWLAQQLETHGDVLPRKLLADGFDLAGRRSPGAGCRVPGAATRSSSNIQNRCDGGPPINHNSAERPLRRRLRPGSASLSLPRYKTLITATMWVCALPYASGCQRSTFTVSRQLGMSRPGQYSLWLIGRRIGPSR